MLAPSLTPDRCAHRLIGGVERGACRRSGRRVSEQPSRGPAWRRARCWRLGIRRRRLRCWGGCPCCFTADATAHCHVRQQFGQQRIQARRQRPQLCLRHLTRSHPELNVRQGVRHTIITAQAGASLVPEWEVHVEHAFQHSRCCSG